MQQNMGIISFICRIAWCKLCEVGHPNEFTLNFSTGHPNERREPQVRSEVR
uniref:Uncharacterized protein n=1 Tax=Arundo donax TaxID=35708 RepID=A0A0A8XQA6_ARUDO